MAVGVEIVIAWLHPPYDSALNKWGTTFADASIALGIVGELIFSRLDARIQTELRKRSNEQLGAAAKSAAEANARAAEANARAEESALELERIKTPRRLTEEQIAALTETASPFAPTTPFDVFVQPDKEPLDLAVQIAEALRAAGWNWMPVNTFIAVERPNTPSIGMMTGVGVRVQVHHSRLDDWKDAALAVGNAIFAAGIAVKVEDITDNSVAVSPIHIRVGAKE